MNIKKLVSMVYGCYSMKCKNCDEKADKLYEYGGSNFCYRCLSEHINDDGELRQLAIEEWIENNCREVN